MVPKSRRRRERLRSTEPEHDVRRRIRGAKNPAEAVRWLQAAAQQENAVAQYSLGVMYIEGLGVKRDPAIAADSPQAADQGHASAQYNLGLMLAQGDGVPQNEQEAANGSVREPNAEVPKRNIISGS